MTLPLALNLQPQESPVHDNGEYLDVIKVWNTIQGEGPYAGYPAVFVRLAGCNLKCAMCDTNYTKWRRKVQFRELAKEVFAAAKCGLVVLTGGEPFRQNIEPFVREVLLPQKYHVQIETNGTLYRENMPWYGDMSVVCSPKTLVLSEELLPHIVAYKYVLQDGYVSEDGLPTITLGTERPVFRPRAGFDRRNIYVQPLDEGGEIRNLANRQAAIESCMKHGYRLSLQLHKYLDLE